MPQLLTSLFAILLLTSFGHADEDRAKDKEPKKARVDSQSDPLPDRALFRIGTTRLQHLGLVQAVAASNDGRYLASYGRDQVIRVWDANDGKPIWAFELRSSEP